MNEALPALHVREFRRVYLSPPQDRIMLIRAGVQAVEMKQFAVDLGIPQDRLFKMVGIAPATVARKALKGETLSRDDSEKMVGMAKLIGQVETMLVQSGDPEQTGKFNSARWLAQWIEEPIPALGGRRPSEYMDTIEGQEMVSRLLMMMQTGAYA
jgi:putative toxin-antitoxin system antitoxin component (TIGR02293 family)